MKIRCTSFPLLNAVELLFLIFAYFYMLCTPFFNVIVLIKNLAIVIVKISTDKNKTFYYMSEESECVFHLR